MLNVTNFNYTYFDIIHTESVIVIVVGIVSNIIIITVNAFLIASLTFVIAVS